MSNTSILLCEDVFDSFSPRPARRAVRGRGGTADNWTEMEPTVPLPVPGRGRGRTADNWTHIKSTVPLPGTGRGRPGGNDVSLVNRRAISRSPCRGRGRTADNWTEMEPTVPLPGTGRG